MNDAVTEERNQVLTTEKKNREAPTKECYVRIRIACGFPGTFDYLLRLMVEFEKPLTSKRIHADSTTLPIRPGTLFGKQLAVNIDIACVEGEAQFFLVSYEWWTSLPFSPYIGKPPTVSGSL